MSQAAALALLIRSLGSIGAKYAVAGSVASSSRGLPRATLDTDLLVEIGPLQAKPFAQALGADWYIDPDFAAESLRRGISFNVIHIPTGHKFDIFPAQSAFNHAELERATIETLTLPGGRVPCHVATAEDIILAKLRWYRIGGETSERQWSDITAVIQVNTNLDTPYLDHWAPQLGVADLLAKAVHDSRQQ
ncbi:MAG TPA: hypothetical protein VGL72_10000 [Bryobacteraceae bacterium]|jgi:hypothetical protein